MTKMINDSIPNYDDQIGSSEVGEQLRRVKEYNNNMDKRNCMYVM